MITILSNIVQVLVRLVLVARALCFKVLHCAFHLHGYTKVLVSSTFETAVGCNRTFWEFTALFKFAKSEWGSTVPRKMDLNWFIPALVKSRVGSERGATGEDRTTVEPCQQLVISFSAFFSPFSIPLLGRGRGSYTYRMYGHFPWNNQEKYRELSG